MELRDNNSNFVSGNSSEMLFEKFNKLADMAVSAQTLKGGEKNDKTALVVSQNEQQDKKLGALQTSNDLTTEKPKKPSLIKNLFNKVMGISDEEHLNDNEEFEHGSNISISDITNSSKARKSPATKDQNNATHNEEKPFLLSDIVYFNDLSQMREAKNSQQENQQKNEKIIIEQQEKKKDIEKDNYLVKEIKVTQDMMMNHDNKQKIDELTKQKELESNAETEKDDKIKKANLGESEELLKSSNDFAKCVSVLKEHKVEVKEEKIDEKTYENAISPSYVEKVSETTIKRTTTETTSFRSM